MSRAKDPYAEHRQRLICLLFALYEMGGGPRKREVVEYIQRQGYLDISPPDVEPYLSQIEPRWNTDIAYRRKDAVEGELLFNATRDAWELTREGRERIEKIIAACRAKKFEVRECYLWTKHLKRALDPDYVPSEKDAVRPRPLTADEIARLV